MIEQAIYHKPETEYGYAKDGKTFCLRIRTAREDCPKIAVVYGGKYDFWETQYRKEMNLSYRDRLYNYYTAELQPEDIRLVYVFEIRQGEKVCFYSEDGLSDAYDYTLNFYNAFQIAYINDSDIHKEVRWMHSACFYQFFIDRFFRGDSNKDDSYINLTWGEIPNPKSFAGGDLKGIGHRETSEDIFPELVEAVEHHIVGYDVTEFIVGNYGGFDRMAARAVLSAKVLHLGITLRLSD